LSPILEDFQTNPFWQAFYADPAGTAFETEITFLLQHYHAIKLARRSQCDFVCDFSLVLDLAYAHATLSEGRREVFQRVLQEIRVEIPPPDLLIHLICEPDVELARIRRRGREVENAIAVDYLAELNRALQAQVQASGIKNVLVIDSAAQNFADDEAVRAAVSAEVAERVGIEAPRKAG
jgi:deoxyadenosine/deoxycytidine kinase